MNNFVTKINILSVNIYIFIYNGVYFNIIHVRVFEYNVYIRTQFYNVTTIL
jgi:hypothetical protein